MINEILNLNENIIFINGLRKYLSYKQNKKISYFKNCIYNISKRYHYQLLNMNLSIGEIV